MTSHIEHVQRSRLKALRNAAMHRTTSLQRGFDGIVDAASDVSTDDEHDPEGHTIAWERQQLAALIDESRTTLVAIECAEQRLEEGLYGICTMCGRVIAADRLEALPATLTCLDCAR